MPTGDRGTLIIQDLTDTTDKSVDLWIQSSTTVSISQMPWSYSIDDTPSDVRSFNFQGLVTRQHLGKVFIGNAKKFTLHLGATGTSALGGPTDFGINPVGYVEPDPTVTSSIVPYINVQGRWYPASMLVNVNGVWTPAG